MEAEGEPWDGWKGVNKEADKCFCLENEKGFGVEKNEGEKKEMGERGKKEKE